jgi:hypothetical protein
MLSVMTEGHGTQSDLIKQRLQYLLKYLFKVLT